MLTGWTCIIGSTRSRRSVPCSLRHLHQEGYIRQEGFQVCLLHQDGHQDGFQVDPHQYGLQAGGRWACLLAIQEALSRAALAAAPGRARLARIAPPGGRQRMVRTLRTMRTSLLEMRASMIRSTDVGRRRWMERQTAMVVSAERVWFQVQRPAEDAWVGVWGVDNAVGNII